MDRDHILSSERDNENTHVREMTELVTPREVKRRMPASHESITTVALGREALRTFVEMPRIGNKLVVVVGPCSINDPESAMEYARWLLDQRKKYGDHLEIIMRVYFEKPRTTVGWKGLINDPYLDESYEINDGLYIARGVMLDITEMGMPVGTEVLDSVTPQYIGGLVTWGALGARTVESQPHRELVSGLSFTTGLKNGTSGDIQVAVDAAVAVSQPHRFFGINDDGYEVRVDTIGNPDTHIILRGGKSGSNYDRESIAEAKERLKKAGLPQLVMVDASHAQVNDYLEQLIVVDDVGGQIANGDTSIMGMAIESNIVGGKQKFVPGSKHIYGMSITDGCIDLDDTAQALATLYRAKELQAA